MKRFYKKAGSLILLFCAGTSMMAQPLTCKVLSQELESLKKQLVPDKRMAVLDIGFKDTLQPVIVVSGETDLPEAKEQVIRFLTDKKVSFADSIRLLPDAALGDKIWALAALSVSNMRSKPDHAAELVSQALMGTPMKVLDSRGSWYLVQTPDNYIGWIDGGGLARFSTKEMERWKKSDRRLFNVITGFAYDRPTRNGGVVSDLVLDDLFEVEAVIKRFLKIRFPDGRTGYVPRDQCISFEDWSKSVPDAQAILSVAKNMTGFPYLWGGASGKAADCSGLVKLAYYSQGIILARDASQQARYGEPVDISDMSKLEPGDLLFFGHSARQITHVGLCLGGGDFIHSSGKVHVSSMDPGDPKYDPSRIKQSARRILNSLTAEGIARVKDHPWYAIQP